jgi:hypothetical protein
VTGRLRRLVALAVTLAPARAVCLLGRLHEPGAGEALLEAGALAEAPRRARLAALATSLQVAEAEDPVSIAPLPPHPLLRRVELERRGRPVVERTQVRAAVAPSRPVA